MILQQIGYLQVKTSAMDTGEVLGFAGGAGLMGHAISRGLMDPVMPHLDSAGAYLEKLLPEAGKSPGVLRKGIGAVAKYAPHAAAGAAATGLASLAGYGISHLLGAGKSTPTNGGKVGHWTKTADPKPEYSTPAAIGGLLGGTGAGAYGGLALVDALEHVKHLDHPGLLAAKYVLPVALGALGATGGYHLANAITSKNDPRSFMTQLNQGDYAVNKLPGYQSLAETSGKLLGGIGGSAVGGVLGHGLGSMGHTFLKKSPLGAIAAELLPVTGMTAGAIGGYLGGSRLGGGLTNAVGLGHVDAPEIHRSISERISDSAHGLRDSANKMRRNVENKVNNLIASNKTDQSE